jgi:hypothetical protein
VYDHKSEHTNQLDYENDFAVILLRKLTHKYAASVSFLTGGFADFVEKYPNSCVKSLLRSRNNSSTSALPRMDSIDSSNNSFEASNVEMLLNSSPQTSTLSSPQVLMRRTPRQLKLSHSLSTFGFFDNSPTVGRHSSSSCAIVTEGASESSPNSSSSLSKFSNNYSSSSSSSLKSSDSTSTLTAQSSGSSSSTAAQTNLAPPQLRQPTKILSYLYLGSEEDACCAATMEALGITSVLNVSVSCKKPGFIKDQNFLRIPVNDGPADKILPFFDIAYRFIGKLYIMSKFEENWPHLVHF